MNKAFQNRVILWGIWILMAMSCAVFAFQQIPMEHYTISNVLITLIGAFLCSFIFITKTEEENIKFMREHLTAFVIIFIIVYGMILEEYKIKGFVNRELVFDFFPFPFFRFRYYLFSIIFLTYFGVWLYRKILMLVRDIFEESGPLDKKIYLIFTVCLSLLAFAAYLGNAKWYLQYDNVYSIDSLWCFQVIFPRIDYYDIRHPILGEAAFPIWSVIHSILSVFAPENLMETLTAVLLQFVNIQLLLLIGIMLKKMTKSRVVFLLYVSSFSVILFSLSLEKYQLCTFIVVLYVYTIYKNMKESSGILVLAAGIMPTSGFIAVLELFSKGSWKDKAGKIAKMFFMGIAVMICLGRAHLFVLADTIAELTSMKTLFASGTFTLKERMVSVTKMLQGCFVPLSAAASDKYLWTSVTSGVTIFSVALILLMVAGVVSHWKEKFVRICSVWTAFSFILFVVLKWYPQESPLFSIYFSWAFIPLVKYGIDLLAEKLHIGAGKVYAAMIIAMLLVNVTAMAEIHQFLLSIIYR